MSKSYKAQSPTHDRIYLGRAAWVKQVAAYHKSGLNPPDYYRRHNLVLSTFRAWIARVARESREASVKQQVIPVKITDTELPKIDSLAD